MKTVLRLLRPTAGGFRSFHFLVGFGYQIHTYVTFYLPLKSPEIKNIYNKLINNRIDLKLYQFKPCILK